MNKRNAEMILEDITNERKYLLGMMLTVVMTLFLMAVFAIPSHAEEHYEPGDLIQANYHIGNNEVLCTLKVKDYDETNGTVYALLGDGLRCCLAYPLDMSLYGEFDLGNGQDVSDLHGGKKIVVVGINDHAFQDCAITSISFAGNEVTTDIGAYAFAGCDHLRKVEIGEGGSIQTIGAHAFDGCIKLTDTGLGDSQTVQSIGDYAYKGCTGLTNTGLETNQSIQSIGESAYEGCTGLTDTGLKTNGSVQTIGKHAFKGCTKLTDTGLGDNQTVQSIGEYAFENCPIKNFGMDSNNTITDIAGGKAFDKATQNGSNPEVILAPDTAVKDLSTTDAMYICTDNVPTFDAATSNGTYYLSLNIINGSVAQILDNDALAVKNIQIDDVKYVTAKTGAELSIKEEIHGYQEYFHQWVLHAPDVPIETLLTDKEFNAQSALAYLTMPTTGGTGVVIEAEITNKPYFLSTILEKTDNQSLSGTYGQRLSTVQLPENWTWKDGNIILEQSGTYDAVLDVSNQVDSFNFKALVEKDPRFSYDEASQILTYQINVTVENAPADSNVTQTGVTSTTAGSNTVNTGVESSNTGMYILIAVIVLVAVGLGVYWVKKRKNN